MPFAEVNGHRIQYVESTDVGYKVQDGKLPIVCIHGLGSSQNYYMPVIPYLDGHRVVALSTYGAAQSKSNGEKQTLEGMADDVVGLMDHLKIPKAVIVGHSMGGPMVLTVAAKYPDRCFGIVAIGCLNPASVKPEMFSSRIETVLKSEQALLCRIGILINSLIGGMEPLANTVPKGATGSKSTPLQRAMIRELILSQDPKSYAAHCDAILTAKDPGFASIKLPVLFLSGDEDQSTPMEGVKYIHDHIGSQNKEIKVYKGVGHWHCIEASEEVGRDIKAFASSLA